MGINGRNTDFLVTFTVVRDIFNYFALDGSSKIFDFTIGSGKLRTYVVNRIGLCK